MKKIIISNKKAYFEYNIIEKYTCGIVLLGSEVKSIRNGNISIKEAYCFIDSKNEIYIKNCNISLHKEGGKHYNHLPLRDRKLLMKKKEILKLDKSLGEKGLTIIPLEVIITNTGFVKVEIGLGKGKHNYDKKQTIKLRDLDRDLKNNV